MTKFWLKLNEVWGKQNSHRIPISNLLDFRVNGLKDKFWSIISLFQVKVFFCIFQARFFIGPNWSPKLEAQKKRALAPREKVALGAGITADVCIIDRSKSDNPFHNFLHYIMLNFQVYILFESSVIV